MIFWLSVKEQNKNKIKNNKNSSKNRTRSIIIIKDFLNDLLRFYILSKNPRPLIIIIIKREKRPSINQFYVKLCIEVRYLSRCNANVIMHDGK